MKTALITGAGQRIGQAVALHLSKEGWDIAIHYHGSEEEAEALSATIRAQGRRALTVRADFMNEEEVKAVFPFVNRQLSPVTCLVNNASYFKNDTLATHSRTLWDAHMGINLRAPLVLMKDFASQLPKTEQGNIINILDYCVWSLPDIFLSYAVSKSALWTLTQMLAVQLAPSIRVNAVGPGPALANNQQTQASFDKAWEAAPLQRSTSPEEICQTISYLLSMPGITGQMIALDGGRHLERAEYR